MPEVAAGTRYRFVPYGGGVEELDRIAIRDRIRSGDIEGHTELAMAGNDDWRPAAAYPELARYFELAAARPQRITGQYLVAPSKPREVQSMGERLLHGLLYPLRGGEALTLLAISIFSVLPFVGWLATLATVAIMLDIIRKSADGSTKMPAMVDTSNVAEIARVYFRVLLVTLISLAPVIAAGMWSAFALINGRATTQVVVPVMIVASALAAIYYPACLATVAVWDNVISALNPAYVFRVISRIGVDYFIVIAAWFVASAAVWAMNFGSFSVLLWIPFVGRIIDSAISLWVLFYASHLLGYAVYRHAPELGWE